MDEPVPLSWPPVDWTIVLSMVGATARRVCKNFGFDEHEADDASQDISLILWLNKDRFHFPSWASLNAWIAKTSYKYACKKYGHRHRTPWVNLPETAPLPAPAETDSSPGLEEF